MVRRRKWIRCSGFRPALAHLATLIGVTRTARSTAAEIVEALQQ